MKIIPPVKQFILKLIQKLEYHITQQKGHKLTIGFRIILMLGRTHFHSTRRSGVSFCPEGLRGSITASICMLEFPLFRLTALENKLKSGKLICKQKINN